MTYRVVLQRLAEQDLYGAYSWAAERAPHTAGRWLVRFQDSLGTLAHQPQRCPLARENGKVEVEIRQFLFGKRPSVFRVLFTIDGSTVRILRIRRAQRRFLSREEIERALDIDGFQD
jgi:plasmid stabilization system protein ParE